MPHSRTLHLISCLVIVAALCGAAGADKYSQPPQMNPSFSFASEINGNWSAFTADDWVCADGQDICSIRWWGSYWNCSVSGCFGPYSDSLNNAPVSGVHAFTVVITDNAPSGGNTPYDHPNWTLGATNYLDAWSITPTAAMETKVGTVVKSTDPSVYEDIYSYSLNLMQTPSLLTGRTGDFQQEQGKKYWLMIFADSGQNTLPSHNS